MKDLQSRLISFQDIMRDPEPACAVAPWPGSRGRIASEPGPFFKWHLDRRRRCLVFGNASTRAWTYEIDLDKCKTSAQVLNWIAQVSRKDWANDKIIGGLVRALDDVLDLQGRLCGCGVERGPIDVGKILRREKKEAR